MYCPYCSSRLAERVKFCPDCGAMLGQRTIRLGNSGKIVKLGSALLAVIIIALFFLNSSVLNRATQIANNALATLSNSTIDPPETVLDHFCQNITFSDWQDAYAAYSPNFQQRVSLLQFENSWSSSPTHLFHVGDCTHSSVLVTQNRAKSTIIVRNTFSPSDEHIAYAVVLVKKPQAWMIDNLTVQ